MKLAYTLYAAGVTAWLACYVCLAHVTNAKPYNYSCDWAALYCLIGAIILFALALVASSFRN